ncbi:urease accessory protein UreD [Paenibacillus arenilitoris]|uniref:Urease accessory protein UreD n=1 Tax=Paenibacillus arenilitoris TaxID=2772299 RepID=A0A927H9J1_9BACL|nr:urease accessory protein UreD [Paenibacillus arenilitoris]MBD2872672.1 urease accessory protein UreD [Paenibacillus arenilitoris]
MEREAADSKGGTAASPTAGADSAIRASELAVSFASRGGRTVLERKYHTAPLKIAKAFPLDRQLGVIVMDVSPGLLEGDHYDLAWTFGRGAHAMMTNQSYTKVHPCLPGGGASMRQTFELADNAVAEHMPEPVMLYRHARFRGETQVRLGAGAVWMQADVLCPGRTPRGERFDYRSFRNELAVRYGEELIFMQRQRIEPPEQTLGAPGCWEDMTHWGSFYLFSDRVRAGHLERLQACIERFDSPAAHPVIAGASLTHRFGVAVSAASTAAWPLQKLMGELWREARASVLELPPLRLLQG